MSQGSSSEAENKRPGAWAASPDPARVINALLNAMPDSAVLCDLDGTILALNTTAAWMIGRPERELIGANAFEIVSPKHRALRVANAAEIKRTKLPLESVVEMNGTWRKTRIVPVLDDAGEVIYLAIYSIDLTQERRAEEELKTSQLRLAALLRNLPQIVLYETGGGREFISENIMDLLGFPASDFTQDRTVFPQLIHPDDNSRMRQQLNAWHAAGEPEPLRLEFRCRNHAGEYIWLADLMVEVKPTNSKPYMAGILMDITQRKQAEEALAQSEANLALAQQLAHIGHWEFRFADGSIHCSAELLRIFGVSEDELFTSEDFFKRVHPQDLERVKSIIDGIRTTDKPADAEYRIIRPNGELRLIKATGRMFRDATGQFTRLLGTAQDITEISQAQEALRANEVKAAELAGLRMTAATYAHEINNPLTGLLALLQMLLDQDCTREQREMLNEAQTAAMRIRDVTSKLQTISNPEWRPYMKDSRIVDLRE